MKFAVLTHNDYSNVGWEVLQCLNLLPDTEARGWKLEGHPSEFKDQLPLWGGLDRDAERYLRDPQVIRWYVHSLGYDFGAFVPRPDQRIVIQHGGSIYRCQASVYANYWNPLVRCTVIETPDLLGLGSKNEIYLPPSVDTDALTPWGRNPGPLRIGHFPSNPERKGTDLISYVLRQLKSIGHQFEFRVEQNWVSHALHQARMRWADLLIDQLKPTIRYNTMEDFPLGEYGVHTREAAAMGKIPLSNHRLPIYEQSFGPSQVEVTNSPEELFTRLQRWINLSTSSNWPQIHAKMDACRAWVVTNHSRAATAKHIERLVLPYLED